jgi:hypothetical protein
MLPEIADYCSIFGRKLNFSRHQTKLQVAHQNTVINTLFKVVFENFLISKTFTVHLIREKSQNEKIINFDRLVKKSGRKLKGTCESEQQQQPLHRGARAD